MTGPLFRTLVVISLVLDVAIAASWAWSGVDKSFHHLGIGRGYRTFDIDLQPGSFSGTLTRYAAALTHEYPDAPLIRTRGYGWFVGDERVSGFEVGNFSLIRQECDYEYRSKVFFISWRLRTPYWLAMILAGIFPAAWLRRRIQISRQKHMQRLQTISTCE